MRTNLDAGTKVDGTPYPVTHTANVVTDYDARNAEAERLLASIEANRQKLFAIRRNRRDIDLLEKQLEQMDIKLNSKLVRARNGTPEDELQTRPEDRYRGDLFEHAYGDFN